MENLTTAISVQIDSKDKELASNILKKLGLNMSTYVNMAIKQLINKDGVPFEVVNPKPTSVINCILHILFLIQGFNKIFHIIIAFSLSIIYFL